MLATNQENEIRKKCIQNEIELLEFYSKSIDRVHHTRRVDLCNARYVAILCNKTDFLLLDHFS